jgi:hypothetical protein
MEELIARMVGLLESLEAAGDKRRYFHATYLRTTIAVAGPAPQLGRTRRHLRQSGQRSPSRDARGDSLSALVRSALLKADHARGDRK